MIKDSIQKMGLTKAYEYIKKEPEKNLPKLMDLVDKYAEKKGDIFPTQRAAARAVINVVASRIPPPAPNTQSVASSGI